MAETKKFAPSYNYEQDDGGQSVEPVVSVQHGNALSLDEDENGQFHRSFTPRQIHVISLGSNIGSGVFIATGKALAQGGPGNMVVAYTLVCSCVWAVLQTLSEMTIAFPTSGNYIDFAGRWVDPAVAFGAGLAEWLGWSAMVAAEAVFFTILVDYWADGAVPQGALLTIFLAVVFVIFLMPNTVFAWFEYVTSLVKIFLFLIIIFASMALVCGAGPRGYVRDGSTWTDLPQFKNGFSGFATCALLAIWAVGDQVFIGIMGGEAQSPRFSLSHATKLVPFRVVTIYMLSVIFITILLPSDNPRLLRGAGAAASPFVISLDEVGVKGLPDILNAGMIVGLVAISAESVYLASRVFRTMAHQRLIPQFCAKVDSDGRPRIALAVTCLLATVLTYINLSAGGTTAFNWLLSITSSSFFVNWIIISWTSFRFHAALKAQNDRLFTEAYAWRSTIWPLAPAWLMLISLLLVACCVASGVNPVGDLGFTAINFYQYMIGLMIIVFCSLAYKVVFRTKWVDPRTADCVTGRRTLSVEEIKELDAYYRLPGWRRFGTYIELW